MEDSLIYVHLVVWTFNCNELRNISSMCVSVMHRLTGTYKDLGFVKSQTQNDLISKAVRQKCRTCLSPTFALRKCFQTSVYVQTLSNEDSCVGHFSCAFVFLCLSAHAWVACSLTQHQQAHTINTAWPQKIERMNAMREEEVQGRKRDQEETTRRLGKHRLLGWRVAGRRGMKKGMEKQGRRGKRGWGTGEDSD